MLLRICAKLSLTYEQILISRFQNQTFDASTFPLWDILDLSLLTIEYIIFPSSVISQVTDTSRNKGYINKLKQPVESLIHRTYLPPGTFKCTEIHKNTGSISVNAPQTILIIILYVYHFLWLECFR